MDYAHGKIKIEVDMEKNFNSIMASLGTKEGPNPVKLEEKRNTEGPIKSKSS